MTTLSIIVTTFNIEDYVRECLESIARQKFTDFEVLVVDDGSSDSTPELIKEFAAHDDRFRPILLAENSPGGVATAANAGLDQATGDWIGFVDGDDYIEPDMFAALVKSGERHGTDLVMCQYQEVIDGTKEFRMPADAHRWRDFTSPSYILDDELKRALLRFIAVPWRKLYRRRLLDDNKIRFPVGDYFYEDNPFHWFSVLSASSIALVPRVLCYHRIGRAGQTMGTADLNLFKMFHHHGTIRAWLEENSLLDRFGVTLLGWVISQMEWISARTPKELRAPLFQTLLPIFRQYSNAQSTAALREGKKGARAEQLVTALNHGSRRQFMAALNGRPDTRSYIRLGFFHLRNSGVRRTAELTSNTVGQKLASSPIGRRLPSRAASAVHGGTQATSQADLMFGLAVLQQQISRVEEKLDRLLDDNGSPCAPPSDQQREDAPDTEGR